MQAVLQVFTITKYMQYHSYSANDLGRAACTHGISNNTILVALHN